MQIKVNHVEHEQQKGKRQGVKPNTSPFSRGTCLTNKACWFESKKGLVHSKTSKR